jgi:hypothetical protein
VTKAGIKPLNITYSYDRVGIVAYVNLTLSTATPYFQVAAFR